MSNQRVLFLLVCFLFLIHLVPAAQNYVPTDKILLSCGGPTSISSDLDGRQWISDIGSKFSLSSGSKSFTSIAAVQKPSVPQVPYMNARIIQSQFTYTFPVTPGRKFIRLYFYPASYKTLDPSNALFTVSTGPFTLLKNFSPAQTAYDYFTKEFSVNVLSDTLNVTFTPASTPVNSYAFINGIEILSHPDIYNTDNTTALENLYRLNVGGNDISRTGDTGLFRSWKADSNYIFGAALGVTELADQNVTINYLSGTPSYVGPLNVYATLRSMGPAAEVNFGYNLTWVLTVDSGFHYLVRLHFCEFNSKITLVNQMVFEILLNNQTAETAADVIAWGETNDVALYKDYVLFVPHNGQPQQDLWLALHPSTVSKPTYYNAILNGVEIFKVNDTQGNLGAPNPGSGKSNHQKAKIGGHGPAQKFSGP